MEDRIRHSLQFSDGSVLELGPRTRVMGVLNVTPDSFSDGGSHFGLADALAAAERLAEQGADIIDVGGESTRPGAPPVDADEESRRVLPVIEGIRRSSTIRLSIDTCKAEVARRALDAGADLVNDVTAFRDPDMLQLVRDRGVPAVVMHMRGSPRTMQRRTDYEDLMGTIAGFLEDCVGTAVAAGVSNDKIVVDPGIGFGKSAAGNLTILRNLSKLKRIGQPVLIGASRKSFIGSLLDLPVGERLEGSLAIAAYASANGAHIIRAHDVEATVRVVRMIDAIRGA